MEEEEAPRSSSARDPREAEYSTTPAAVEMEVMEAVQEVQPPAVMEEERAEVKAVMVAEVGAVPLKAEGGREEREKDPDAEAGYTMVVEEGVREDDTVPVLESVGVMVFVGVMSTGMEQPIEQM